MAGEVDKEAYSVAEVCQRLGVSVRAYYRMQRRGDGFPVVKIGSRTVIRRETFEAWLRAREGQQ